MMKHPIGLMLNSFLFSFKFVIKMLQQLKDFQSITSILMFEKMYLNVVIKFKIKKQRVFKHYVR